LEDRLVEVPAAVRRDGAEVKAASIRAAALELFWQRGYHGTSVRQIAAATGVAVANVYHYYPSKLYLLYDIVDQATDLLARKTDEGVRLAADDPTAQLRAVVDAHVRFHVEFQRESFVGQSELRSLPEPFRERYVAKRDAQQARFSRPILRGIEEGAFDVPYPQEAIRALVTMCTAVALWYRPDGGLGPQEIVERYTQLALQMVGARVAQESAPSKAR
jgi:AcrR family transcriptional regulator